MREELKELSKDFDRSEDDLKSLQSGVGQIVGEVLRQLTEDKCKFLYLCVHLRERERDDASVITISFYPFSSNCMSPFCFVQSLLRPPMDQDT